MARLEIRNNGVVELNKVASRKTGEIEAQTPLKSDIATLENGMIVFVDAIANELVLTANDNTVKAPYLHFSNPRRYEIGKSGMENFVYENNEDYLPRVYKLTAGDIFTTNVADLADFNYEGLAKIKDGVLTTPEVAGEGNFAVKPTLLPNNEKGFEVRFLG